ncbi:class IV adenylate cyclase [Streptomyces griseoluteus]
MEVESKVRLEPGEEDRLASTLKQLAIAPGEPARQRDVYYKERGFRDRVQGPGSYLVRVRYTDAGTTLNMKRLTAQDGVWEETETSVGRGEVAESIIQAIGAEHAVTVAKVRRMATVDDLEVIIDEVDDLGTFLELAVETDDDTAAARAKIDAFLGTLRIAPERVELRGYPTMLLEAQGVKFSVK